MAIDRAGLLDLLTTAAQLGRNETYIRERAQVREDITSYLESRMRDEIAAALAPDLLQNVSDQLGQAFHTSLRKGSDHPAARRAWQAIQDLPGDEWAAVLNFLRSGLGLPERST